jgi:chromosome segregation ATPase
MTIFDFIFSHLDTIGIIVVGSVLIFQRYSSGSSALRKEINDEYKERNAQLEARIQANLDEIQKTNIEVAKLTGIIQEKDKHIESLTKILQGRNPEMIELLKEIKEGNNTVQEFMKTMYTLIDRSNQELGYQTEILEKSQERNKRIDVASSAHKGNVLRTPAAKITRIKKK